MGDLNVATVQFENAGNDKLRNIDKIAHFARKARGAGADVVAFPECGVTGYTFAKKLSRNELAAIAEPIPNGKSIRRLTAIAAKVGVHICAGLFEIDEGGKLYNAYVCVGPNGLIGKHRKIHPFINPHLSAGNSYAVFELNGWQCGILICYDNNVVENVRATALLGAEIIFMPHVTMCTPSPRPGAGFVDPGLWRDKDANPARLRAEFDGPKGRSWLMKWLPARAYDNGVYVVFSNPIGMDDDQLKNGCAMIIDPFGDIIGECRELGDDFALSTLTQDKLQDAGGHRYRLARKPALYRSILGREHLSTQHVAWYSTGQ
jgi:predicted amidohydrolase